MVGLVSFKAPKPNVIDHQLSNDQHVSVGVACILQEASMLKLATLKADDNTGGFVGLQ